MKQISEFLEDFLPFWPELDPIQQKNLISSSSLRTFQEGTVLHRDSEDCTGLFLILDGQLRAYMVSENGKEITLYRLFNRDICLFSASCMMKDIQFDITIETERATQIIVIPTCTYQAIMNQSAMVSNYTNQLMASRFSDVMWLMEQILFKSFDKRLAAFLLEQSSIDDNDRILMTHEKIAGHLGTAREVVTRMLKYFQSEGAVSLFRGGILIEDRGKLLSFT